MMIAQKSFIKDKVTINKMMTSNKSLKSILHFIISCIEKYYEHHNVSGSILLHDDETNQLTTAVNVSLPEQFIQRANPITISPYSGPSGIAGHFKKAVVIADIENNPLMDEQRCDVLMHGFRSCVSIPLLSSEQKLLGTIELYSRQLGGPSEQCLRILNIFSKLAASVIETANHRYSNCPLFAHCAN